MASISCKRLPFALVLAVALAMAAAPARAQQGQPSLIVNQLDATAYPALRAVVTALDATGVPEQGLTAEQFQAFDGETPLRLAGVQSAQDASVKLSVVVAIDVSGSMAGEPMDRAKQAANEFIRALGPNDEAALVTFNATVAPVVPFTSDRAKLTNAIAALQAVGGTALYEAVQTASFIANASDAPRSAVVLLSDGQNDTQASDATAVGSLAAAQGAGVPVFTVGFGAAPDVGYLEGLSAATQGQYRAANAANVSTVYADIALLLRNQYVLTMTATAAADGKPESLRLIATVGGAPSAAVAEFTRGTAAVAPQATAPAPAPAPEVKAPDGGSTSRVPLVVFSAVVLLVLAGIGGVLFTRYRRQQRILQHQMQVVAPNPRQAAAHPLPVAEGAAVAASSEIGTGRLVEMHGNERGRVFHLGGGAAVLGSSPRLCTIVLDGADVAPEHCRIWLREGRYMLHHAGGMRRKTLVGGKEAEWVVLEAGDEVRGGSHRLVFESGG